MQQLFKYYIKSENVIFKYANGESEKSGKEFHTFNEIILFLDGEAELIGENIHTNIKPNTLIVIPKETYHQVIIKGNKNNYHRCTLSFFDTSETIDLSSNLTKITLLEYDFDFKYIFGKLINLSQQENKNNATLLKAFLTLILCEILAKNSISINETSQNPIIESTIFYINQNLNKNISINEIANAHNISPSSLSHIFKKEMNIPIHQYIIKKRLITAHHKINSGTPSTTAAIECGFNDYSGFYKQYKNMFGYPPSKNKKTSD